MFYQNLKFPKVKNRPFFYTNFVQTIDGKVAVKKPGYWPIGSKTDYQVLLELRAYADALIHGGNLAREFGNVTLVSLEKTKFKSLRKKLGKTPLLPYYIVTNTPEVLASHPLSPRPVSTRSIRGGSEASLRCGNVVVGELQDVLKDLKEKGYKHVLVEGGPTLLGGFLSLNLIDEIFLTISPKIYGSEQGKTLTLVEGVLFSPPNIKKLKLVSIKKIGQEVFLRYRPI